MLAVVDAQPVALEGVGRAAEPAPHLDERHLRAPLGTVERGGDARKASPDDERRGARRSPAARPTPPSMLRAATSAFSRTAATPLAQRPLGIGRDATEQASVDAGHREHARGAGPVQQRRQLHSALKPGCARCA